MSSLGFIQKCCISYGSRGMVLVLVLVLILTLSSSSIRRLLLGVIAIGALQFFLLLLFDAFLPSLFSPTLCFCELASGDFVGDGLSVNARVHRGNKLVAVRCASHVAKNLEKSGPEPSVLTCVLDLRYGQRVALPVRHLRLGRQLPFLVISRLSPY